MEYVYSIPIKFDNFLLIENIIVLLSENFG